MVIKASVTRFEPGSLLLMSQNQMFLSVWSLSLAPKVYRFWGDCFVLFGVV
jgi:hypothetical protein